jgi:hypothetical protein
MDPSLAKGLRNQLFREIDDDIAAFISKWRAYCQKSKPQKSRSNWMKFSNDIESVYGQYMLANHSGGTDRKPFLCLSTFENTERTFNTWSERCLSSKVLYFNFDPIGVNSQQSGFNISEHAIQRIFQRSYSDQDPMAESFKKINFTNELRLAPLWSFFWSLLLIELSNNKKVTDIGISVIIPTVSGLLLGEIFPSNFHKCEIRTFISKQQFSAVQLVHWQSMMRISEKYLKSVIPFLCFEFIYAKPGSLDRLVEFISDTQELRQQLGYV